MEVVSKMEVATTVATTVKLMSQEHLRIFEQILEALEKSVKDSEIIKEKIES